MSDQATATPTSADPTQPGTVQAKPDTAVPVPPKTVPNPEQVLANIKARIADANKPQADPPKTDQVSPAKDGEIKPDLASLMAELVKAQNALNEYKDKVKALSAHEQEANLHRELRELWEKDKRQAIARLSGKDPEEATADIVELFYQDMADKPNTVQDKPSKSEAMLMAKLEELTKKLEALEGQRKTEADQQHAGSVKAQEEATKAYLKSIALQHKDKFEVLSRDENISEALDKAIANSATVGARFAQKHKQETGEELDLSKLSPEQADSLAREVLADVEHAYAELGKRFAKAAPAAKPSVYDRPLTKPSIQFEKPPKGNESFEEYKARMRRQFEQRTG